MEMFAGLSGLGTTQAQFEHRGLLTSSQAVVGIAEEFWRRGRDSNPRHPVGELDFEVPPLDSVGRSTGRSTEKVEPLPNLLSTRTSP